MSSNQHLEDDLSGCPSDPDTDSNPDRLLDEQIKEWESLRMDRGEGVVRWSPNESRDEFLTIDFNYRIVQLYKPVGHAIPESFEYEPTSKHVDFQALTAYDWSPKIDGLVAVGTKGGDVHLLRVDDGSNDSMVLSLKLQRACQTVAFNSTGLLAVGLDRIRNDHCLQIWDVNQRLSSWDPKKKGWQSPPLVEAFPKLEPSVAVTSARFFQDQPHTLVVGIKNQSVRIHDLRDPSGAVITFQTRCNNNIAIDNADPNYFASSSLDLPAVMVWDRRAGSRHSASKTYLDSVDAGELPWGCALRIPRAIDSQNEANIRSLRYCRDRRGLLGVLSSAGEVQIICTEKEYVEPSPDNDVEGTPELLEVKRSHVLQYSFSNENFGHSYDERIVSFDWMTLGTEFFQPRMIVRRSNSKLEVLLMPTTTQHLHFDLLDFSSKAKHTKSFTLPKFANPKETRAVLGSILETPARINVSFGSVPPKIASATQVPETGGSTDEMEFMKLASEMVKKLNITKKVKPTAAEGDKEEGQVETKCEDSILTSLFLSRIQAGYMFDCDKNCLIAKDDTCLVELWEWIAGAQDAAKDGGMISGSLNLAYMGVKTIWDNDLGAKFISRLFDTEDIPTSADFAKAIEDINKRAGRPRFQGVGTAKPHHRQLCLAICGWGKSVDQLEKELKDLEKAGNYTKAAAIALFETLPNRAIEILRRGSSDLLFLALAIRLRVQGNVAAEEVAGLDESFKRHPEWSTDPYLIAMYVWLDTGNWKAVVEEDTLPMQDRVGVAVRNLDDAELSNWLEKQMAECIKKGDIEGIVMSGISDQMVELLTTFIDLYGDFQSAILIMSFTFPLYVDDPRCWQWRKEYQELHNKNKLFVPRAIFDVKSTQMSRRRDGTTAIKPAPRQVTLRCVHCDTAYTNDISNTAHNHMSLNTNNDPAPGPPMPDRNPLYPSGAHAGILCPTCGRHLPRCAICLMTLGMPRSDRDPMPPKPSEKMANFIGACLKCDHAWHADHGREWFKIHNECPVSDCHCHCNEEELAMKGAQSPVEDEKDSGKDKERETEDK